jgi:serine/threonine protein kinase
MDVQFKPGDFLQNRRYEIKEHMRSPSGKDVYRAYDHDLDCEVTLDVFSNNYIMPESGLPVAKWEARVLNRLGDHRNIARHHGYWVEHDEVAIMATRYLPGGRLEELIAHTRTVGEALPVQRILQLSTELADGLVHIHKCRLLYLDLQPHNVLFDEWGTPRLVDFDTAVSLDNYDTPDLSHRPVVNYMAPEMLQRQDVDARADLYSLGATIYEMSEGHPPFTGDKEQVLFAYRDGPPSFKREDLPAGLRELISSLLALNRDQRPAGASEVMSRLIRLRTARDNVDRLLASNVGTVLKPPLATYLAVNDGALIQSPSAADLPDDHRYLMQAIIALAETDHRRAVIDAATATEIALRLGISDYMRKRNWSYRDINRTIRDAKGLDGLFTRYYTFTPGHKLPLSLFNIRSDLASVRNEAAHTGRIPSPKKAIRAVEIAQAMVNAVHPFKGKL